MFHQHNYPRNEYRSPTPLKPHTLTSTNTHMLSPAHTRTRKKPYAKRRSGLTKQRSDDVTHKPPMGRQLWKRLCAERVNVFQTVLSNTHTHTQIPHTRKNTHTDTQVLGPPHQEGLILQWTPTLAKTGCAVMLPPRIKRANLLLKHAKMISLTLYNNVQLL